MNIPEITLKKIIDYLLNAVVVDFKSKSNQQETFLYKLFNGSKIEGYDYFVQAKSLLVKKNDDPRKLQTRIFYDRTRAGFPTIHITLPNENPYGDGIGYDRNYQDPTFNDTDGTFTSSNTRTFNTRYNVICTSDNTFEVLIIYYLLKALITSKIDIFELNGIRNIKTSGQDLIINADSMPQNIFMRGLMIDCFYEFSMPDLDATEMLLNIEFQGSVEEEIVQDFTLDGEVTYFFCNSSVVIV